MELFQLEDVSEGDLQAAESIKDQLFLSLSCCCYRYACAVDYVFL